MINFETVAAQASVAAVEERRVHRIGCPFAPVPVLSQYVSIENAAMDSCRRFYLDHTGCDPV